MISWLSSVDTCTVFSQPITCTSLNPAMKTPSIATITILIMLVSWVLGNIKRSVPIVPCCLLDFNGNTKPCPSDSSTLKIWNDELMHSKWVQVFCLNRTVSFAYINYYLTLLANPCPKLNWCKIICFKPMYWSNSNVSTGCSPRLYCPVSWSA